MSPSDCLAKPNAWLRPRPVPLPTSLVVKNGSKIVSSMVGAMPVPVSVTAMATKSPLRADCARRAGMPSTLRTRDGQPAFAVHGIAAVDGEVDQRGLELRDIGDRKAIGVAISRRRSGCGRRPAGRIELRDGLDLRADIEHLRLQRLPAGERQQLCRSAWRRAPRSRKWRRCSGGGVLPAVRGGAGSRSRSG